MIKKAIIIPTGDEIQAEIVLDTDSPMIMQTLLSLNGMCSVLRHSPVADIESNIIDTIKESVDEGYDFIVLIGGSGGGHRYSNTLGKDYTHSSLEQLLEKKYSSEIYGKNGHMWSKLMCGTIKDTLVINVPGPFKEAEAAIKAFKTAYLEDCNDLEKINKDMTNAVKAQYGA